MEVPSKITHQVSSVTQLCLTLCDAVYCTLPGPFVHEIFQARIMGWVIISFSRNEAILSNKVFERLKVSVKFNLHIHPLNAVFLKCEL